MKSEDSMNMSVQQQLRKTTFAGQVLIVVII